MNAERTWRGQPGSGSRDWMGMGKRGKAYGWGLLHCCPSTPAHLHGQVQPCSHSVHPSTLPVVASPSAVPAPGFWYFGFGWVGRDPQGHQGHPELMQPPLTVPQHPACPLATVYGAEHQQLSPVCGRDRADPLLKHQRCSKFFNLRNRSISNYHVSHS